MSAMGVFSTQRSCKRQERKSLQRKSLIDAWQRREFIKLFLQNKNQKMATQDSFL